MVRVTGRDWSLNDGGETTIVINDVMLPRRGNGEHRLALKFCGLKCRAKRSNRGFLLAITGIIASKHQLYTSLHTTYNMSHYSPQMAITFDRNPLKSPVFFLETPRLAV